MGAIRQVFIIKAKRGLNMLLLSHLCYQSILMQLFICMISRNSHMKVSYFLLHATVTIFAASIFPCRLLLASQFLYKDLFNTSFPPIISFWSFEDNSVSAYIAPCEINDVPLKGILKHFWGFQRQKNDRILKKCIGCVHDSG